MGFSKNQHPVYIPLQPESEEDDQTAYRGPIPRSVSFLIRFTWITLLLLISSLIVLVGTVRGRSLLGRAFSEKSTDVGKEVPNSCVDPPIRREWRSLASSEKFHYLESVQCLRQMPSRLGPKLTVYDDFPHIHNIHGVYGMNISPTRHTNVRYAESLHSPQCRSIFAMAQMVHTCL